MRDNTPRALAPTIMAALMRRLRLRDWQAAAILGGLVNAEFGAGA